MMQISRRTVEMSMGADALAPTAACVRRLIDSRQRMRYVGSVTNTRKAEALPAAGLRRGNVLTAEILQQAMPDQDDWFLGGNVARGDTDDGQHIESDSGGVIYSPKTRELGMRLARGMSVAASMRAVVSEQMRARPILKTPGLVLRESAVGQYVAAKI